MNTIRLQRIVLVLLVLANMSAMTNAANAQQAERSSLWSDPVAINLPSSQGNIQGFKRLIALAVKEGSEPARTQMAQLITVPSLRLFWIGPEHSSYKFFVRQNQLVGVRGLTNNKLSFSPSSERLTSATDMQSVDISLTNKLGNYAESYLVQEGARIRLEDYLGLVPFTEDIADPRGSPAPTVDSVSVSSTGSISISLSGGKDNQVKAVVTLSDFHTVTQATLKGTQVYPK